VSRNPDSWVSKPDGSSSLLLTSSGVSSEVVNPTGGQFGYVVMRAVLGAAVFRAPACEPWTDFIPGQIYFLTRLTTLMTVIINLVTLNLTTKTNCQVRPALYIYLLGSASSAMTLQGLGQHSLCEYIPPCTSVFGGVLHATSYHIHFQTSSYMSLAFSSLLILLRM
jgi:hypothetical protein